METRMKFKIGDVVAVIRNPINCNTSHLRLHDLGRGGIITSIDANPHDPFPYIIEFIDNKGENPRNCFPEGYLISLEKLDYLQKLIWSLE